MSGPPIFPHKDVAPGIKLYDPPVEEFAVEALESKATKMPAVSASSIVVIVTGKAHFKAGSTDLEVHRGDVIFLSAALNDVQVLEASPDFACYRAFTPKPQV